MRAPPTRYFSGDRRIQVLKTYDPNYAREMFDEMDEDAQAILWKSLDIEQTYGTADLPAPTDTDRADFLWDELNELRAGRCQAWPLTTAYARTGRTHEAAEMRSVFESLHQKATDVNDSDLSESLISDQVVNLP